MLSQLSFLEDVKEKKIEKFQDMELFKFEARLQIDRT
jgi:hypothetical protein